jgi:hypothetical protein
MVWQLITTSSAPRSCTTFRVTVTVPAELSVKAPSFGGFVFMS